MRVFPRRRLRFQVSPSTQSMYFLFSIIAVACLAIMLLSGIVPVLAFDLPATAVAYAVPSCQLVGEMYTAPAGIRKVCVGMGRMFSHFFASFTSCIFNSMLHNSYFLIEFTISAVPTKTIQRINTNPAKCQKSPNMYLTNSMILTF